jgi:hypothetical protein
MGRRRRLAHRRHQQVGLFRLGQERLGAFGSLPVRGGGSVVERGLLSCASTSPIPCRCCLSYTLATRSCAWAALRNAAIQRVVCA